MKSLSTLLPIAFAAATIAFPHHKRTAPAPDTLLKTPVSEYLLSYTDKISVKSDNGVCGEDGAKANCIELRLRQGTVVGTFTVQKECNCNLVINGGSNMEDIKTTIPSTPPSSSPSVNNGSSGNSVGAHSPSTPPVVASNINPISQDSENDTASLDTPGVGTFSSVPSSGKFVPAPPPGTTTSGVGTSNLSGPGKSNTGITGGLEFSKHSTRADSSQFIPAGGYVLRFENSPELDKYVKGLKSVDGGFANNEGDFFEQTPEGCRVTFKSWIK
jgi:hypothetical protein